MKCVCVCEHEMNRLNTVVGARARARVCEMNWLNMVGFCRYMMDSGTAAPLTLMMLEVLHFTSSLAG